MGSPVRRPAGKVRIVLATKAELDSWIAAIPLRATFQLSRPDRNFSIEGKELKRNLAELRRLRHETTELSKDMTASLELLQTTFSSLSPKKKVPRLRSRKSANVVS